MSVLSDFARGTILLNSPPFSKKSITKPGSLTKYKIFATRGLAMRKTIGTPSI